MGKLVNIAVPLIFAAGFVSDNLNASPDKEDSVMVENILPYSIMSDSPYIINSSSWINFEPLQFAISGVTKDLDLRGLEAKAVLLNFWGAWCGYCRADAPKLEGIWKQYKDKGLVVVSLHNYEDSSQRAYDFAAKNNLTYPVGMDDSGDVTFKKYRIMGVPYQVLVDGNGSIIARGHPDNLRDTLIKFMEN